MPTSSELQAYLELQKENGELQSRVEKLEIALRTLKKIFESEAEIIVTFSGDRDEPRRDLRLYTNKGMALGFGKMLVNSSPKPGSQDDLFSPVETNTTYMATLKVKELFNVKS